MKRLAVSTLSPIFSAFVIGLAGLIFPMPASAATIAEQTQEYSAAFNVSQLIQELGSNLSGKAVTFTFRVKTDASNTQQFSFTSHNTRIYDKDNNNSFIASCIPADSNPNDPLRGLQFNTQNVPAGYQDVSIDFSCRNYSFIPGHRYIIKLDNSGLFTKFHFAAAPFVSGGTDYFPGGGLRYGNDNISDFANNSGNCDPAKYFWNSTNPAGNGCWVWTNPKDDIYFKLTATPYSPPVTKTPVIFIPGIGGSELKVASETNWSAPDGHGGNYENVFKKDEAVWMNLIAAANPLHPHDDYFDVLRMENDGLTSTADIQTTDRILSEAYANTIKHFTDNGYVLGEDLFVFPYDWRQDVTLSSELLDLKVDQIRESVGSQKVDLVAHSMGGLVARSYISNQENSIKVRKLISLGSPYLGAVKFLKALREGICLSKSDVLTNPCIGVNSKEVHDLLQNMIGGYELAPSEKYYEFYSGIENYPTPILDSRDLDNNKVTGQLNYEQTKQLLANLDHNTGLFNPAEEFHYLDNQLVYSNGVEIFLIVGSGKDTLGQIIEKSETNFEGISTPYTEPLLINGDGTVPLYSASLQDEERGLNFLNGNAKVYYTNQSHEGLVNHGPALNLTTNILTDNSSIPLGVSNNPKKLTGKLLGIFSPVNIHVYDTSGNHTGLISDGDYEVQIPGSSYETLGDAKYIFLPDDGVYTVIFDATDEGSFDFKIQSYIDNQLTKTVIYDDIPLTHSTHGVAMYDSISTLTPLIKLDHDGNGSEDSQVESTGILTGLANYDSIAPITLIELNGTPGNNNWFKSDVLVKLSSIDDGGSGINKIEYSLNESNIQTYDAPIMIRNEEITHLKFRSVDNSGNGEKPHEIEIKIDKTEPQIVLNSDTQSLWPPNGKMTDVNISGFSKDINLKDTSFQIDDEYQLIQPKITMYNQKIQLQASREETDEDGRIYRITAFAEDFAGNIGKTVLEILVPHDQNNQK